MTATAATFSAGQALVTAAEMQAAADAHAWLFGSQPKPAAHHGYDVAGLPVLTPDTWRRARRVNGRVQSMFCRGHHPADCPVCAWFAGIEADAFTAPWQKYHRMPGNRPRWRSADEALECYWALVRDGYPAGSVSGTLVNFGRIGCWVQSGGRVDSAAERAADDVVMVEAAIRHAYRHRQRWRPYAAILLARRAQTTPVDIPALTAALGLSRAQVGAIVRTGMRGVRADLAARGLIPLPRRGTRAHVEACARGEEICNAMA